MTRIFVASFLFLLIISTSAQEVRKSPVYANDTAYRAMLLRFEEEAIEKRKLLLEEWENANADSVFKVNFSNLYFEEVPDISRFRNLKVIEGGSNKITVLPKSTFVSDSLQRLVFRYNEIKRVRFRSNSTITSVDLSKNKLKKIPRSIKKLKHLRQLDLSDNQLNKIPRFLRKCDNLQEITLNFNQLELSERSVRNLAHIPLILLAGNKLSKLPENIGELTAARKLNFSVNELSDVPSTFANLDSLTSVIFYKNQFSEIPPEIFSLKSLEELDFYYNQIDEIPDEVGELTNLEQLFLSFNSISTLPQSISGLQNLKYFYIHHNKLVIVPDWILLLSKLERLDLSYNKIMALPDLSQIATLKEVDLQDNQINSFPWKLFEKENMDMLLISNNPLILDEDEREFLEKWVSEQDHSKVWLVY